MLLFWHIYHPEFQWWCLFCGLCHVYQYHLPNTWKIPPEKISNLSRDKENCAVQPCGLCENYGVKKWEQDALILNVPSADPCIKPFTLGLRGLDQFLQHWNQLIKQWFYFKPGWAWTDGWLDESSHMMTLYKKNDKLSKLLEKEMVDRIALRNMCQFSYLIPASYFDAGWVISVDFVLEIRLKGDRLILKHSVNETVVTFMPGPLKC